MRKKIIITVSILATIGFIWFPVFIFNFIAWLIMIMIIKTFIEMIW